MPCDHIYSDMNYMKYEKYIEEYKHTDFNEVFIVHKTQLPCYITYMSLAVFTAAVYVDELNS